MGHEGAEGIGEALLEFLQREYVTLTPVEMPAGWFTSSEQWFRALSLESEESTRQAPTRPNSESPQTSSTRDEREVYDWGNKHWWVILNR